MKITIIPDKWEDLTINNNYEAIIVGLNKFSVHSGLSLSLEELISLVEDYPDKEIFVSMNKNMFNKDIKVLKEALKSLSNLSIKGVMFYDQAVLYFVNKDNLELDLVWNQTHMVTNYQTVNYYHEKGVDFAWLAPEITLDESLEIKEKSQMKLFVNLYGRAIMSHSRRHLVDNFYENINKENNDGDLFISDKDGAYVVRDNEDGTSFMSRELINNMAVLDHDFDYAIVRKDGIDDETFSKLLDLSKEYSKSKNKDNLEKIVSLIGNNTGFNYKKTIFKVGKNAR